MRKESFENTGKGWCYEGAQRNFHDYYCVIPETKKGKGLLSRHSTTSGVF